MSGECDECGCHTLDCRCNVIFDITRRDWKYKGVLLAQVDTEEINKEMNAAFPTPKSYIAGIMGIIWVDERGVWNAKVMVKFPSGNKQVLTRIYEGKQCEGVNINTTYVLQDLYQLPIVNKNWYPNKDESPCGILDILAKTNMIDSYEVVE